MTGKLASSICRDRDDDEGSFAGYSSFGTSVLRLNRTKLMCIDVAT